MTRLQIMLRNIPNRVDQGMLKDLIDHTSFGRYDFMYLRIGNCNFKFLKEFDSLVPDFANNCNVGYAFINFVDVSPFLSVGFISNFTDTTRLLRSSQYDPLHPLFTSSDHSLLAVCPCSCWKTLELFQF